MFDTGYLLFCKNFQFNDGGDPTDKYFIVLKRTGDDLILGSLPTRKNSSPGLVDAAHGCINKDDRCFNCYIFEANRPICDTGFSFDLPTFVYGDSIQTYEGKVVDANYTLGKTYAVMGRLNQAEYDALIACMTGSTSVKNRIKRILAK